MAKYTRHDARNKKKDKHKFLTLDKDVKLHQVKQSKHEKYGLKYEEDELYT